VTAADINHEILDEFDPPKRSRQYIAGMLARYAGVRIAGFFLERMRTEGKWSADYYRLSLPGVSGFHRTASPDSVNFVDPE
jgi:hypothetical protein